MGQFTLNRALCAAILAAALASCAQTPEKMPPGELLSIAHSEYDAARLNPNVARYGADELVAAEAELRRAKQSDLNESERNHHAYLARRHVEIARAQTREQLAQQEIQSLRQQPPADAVRQPVTPASEDAEALRAHTQAQEARDTALAAQLASETPGNERLDSEVEQLEAEMAALEVETAETDRGLVLTLGDRFFASGATSPTPGLGRKLHPLVEFLDQHPGHQVVVEGHTDSATPLIESLRLSQGRAETVRLALIQQGISPSRIEAQGYGPDEPIANNDSAAGRERNRRVEIVVKPTP